MRESSASQISVPAANRPWRIFGHEIWESLVSAEQAEQASKLVAHQKPISYDFWLRKPSNFEQPIDRDIESRIYDAPDGLRWQPFPSKMTITEYKMISWF